MDRDCYIGIALQRNVSLVSLEMEGMLLGEVDQTSCFPSILFVTHERLNLGGEEGQKTTEKQTKKSHVVRANCNNSFVVVVCWRKSSLYQCQHEDDMMEGEAVTAAEKVVELVAVKVKLCHFGRR